MSSSILFFAVFFCIVGWFVIHPLIKSQQTNLDMILDNVTDVRKELRTKRSELMRTLRELDFDFETGKLSKEDYVQLHKKYEQETVDTLKKIDMENIEWNQFETKVDTKLG